MSVKYGILTILYNGINHGYDLKVGVDSLIGLKGKINPGQIYTTLDRLTRDGMVTSAGTDDKERKRYAIEVKGMESLEKWLLDPVPYHSVKEDFFFKWSCARKIHFKEEKQMLDQQKALIIKETMELSRLKTELLVNGDEDRYLLVTGTLLHLEADLNWITRVENRHQ
ncbi:PadR family transcriptional regulator [Halalkalibacter sp. APA_J-10(15)]|uniref:PadR family transcriptional regulator n=1 Tax=Halalkalibacter sp. APA_J-10(15) TaxID=2933805 RepID=UPI001FF41126|nr:PadR family transcriptional regulator [Halalkalibacter sp. APA_J-10(15)]MCK0473253.1 PadR family transcriptional regulator [Halalkalibacter sp. APA_J-10(15)]